MKSTLVTHVIVSVYEDSSTSEKNTSKDSWLSKWGKPTKANFEKIVSKGMESGDRLLEAKLVSRNETLFTFKPSDPKA